MTRSGFDRAFLAVDVPLPDTADPAIEVLDYTHFSIGLHTGRRLAAWTAVNIDGTALVDVARSGGDDWHLDPRVQPSQQVGEELYRRNDLDRGHLVRRRDPVWGDRATAERANQDTFVYTNAAPQAAQFNQSKELWLGLEDYLLTAADAADVRLSVLTGCLFDPDDQRYRGVQLPRWFWKAAAWVQGGELHSTGYLLDQSPQLDDIDLQGMTADQEPLLGPWRTYHVPVAGIADRTGLDLGSLPAADGLDVTTAISGRWRPLHTYDQIKL